jgi:hypothetical protein
MVCFELGAVSTCGLAAGLALPKYIRPLGIELGRVNAAGFRDDEIEASQLIMQTGWPPRETVYSRPLPVVRSSATRSRSVSDYDPPNKPATAYS